jgi:hypothetical protein
MMEVLPSDVIVVNPRCLTQSTWPLPSPNLRILNGFVVLGYRQSDAGFALSLIRNDCEAALKLLAAGNVAELECARWSLMNDPEPFEQMIRYAAGGNASLPDLREFVDSIRLNPKHFRCRAVAARLQKEEIMLRHSQCEEPKWMIARRRVVKSCR